MMTKKTDPYEPWNKGKAQGQKTPFALEQVQTIKALLVADNRARDLALFSTALDTMLRSVDLLALTVDDCSDQTGKILAEFTVRQQKTRQPLVVALQPNARAALKGWIIEAGKGRSDYLFTGLRKSKGQAITRRTYRKLVKQWAGLARLDVKLYSTHSLRRTKAALVFEQTGNIEAVRQLLGQSDTAATSRYLGLEMRGALELASGVRF